MRPARLDRPELEHRLAVHAALGYGRRLDRVDGHALEPARCENEDGVTKAAGGLDREAGFVQETAANTFGRVQAQRGARRGDIGVLWLLSEDVQQREDRDQRCECEEPTPDPELAVPPFELPIS